jgi:phosphopantothenoylcysteine decarboxylase/phosphopantothenate--cysteine ligase
VTAGPTREAIDPVRFLSNRSSGRMGVALATALSHAGAQVTLVHGPMEVPPPPCSTNIAVESAAAMAEAVLSRADSFDIFVLCAAVADFTVQPASQKLKKDRFNGILQLEPTTDILASLGARRQPRQLLVGFAAESEAALENARSKLVRKGADLLFVNQVGGPDCPFSAENSHLTCLDACGSSRDLGRAAKMQHAQTIATLLHQRRSGTT